MRAGIRESRTFATRRQAVDWIHEREDEIAAGNVLARTQSFNTAAERWAKARELSASDAVRLRALARREWAAGPIAALTPETLSTWRDARLQQVGPATVAREMTVIRSVIEFARLDLGWLAVNPVRDVRRPPQPPPRRRPISDDELAALLVGLDYLEGDPVTTVRHEVAVALLLAIETAMRAGEILGLRWQDVRGQVAHLPTTKNGDRRDVPLSRRALALLAVMRGRRLAHVRVLKTDGRIWHIDARTLDVLFRRARDQVGLSGLHFHDARATALTRLAKILSPLDLARMVGHRDLGSLMLYYAEPAASIAARLG